MTHETEASMGTLVRGAIDDVRELFREELTLARAELRHELGKAVSAAIGFGSAAAAFGIGVVFLLIAVALGLADLLDWPAWTGFVLVSVVLAAAGIELMRRGRQAARGIQPLPRTAETVRETFQ